MGDETLAGMVPDIIRPRLAKFEAELDAVTGEPDEDEATHQARVTARRLAAALDTFAPVLRLPDGCRLRRLRRVEQRLGDLRDLDVLTARVEHEADRADPELLPVLERMLARLEGGRERAVRRARRAVQRPGLRRTMQAVAQWLEAPRYRSLAMVPAADVVPDLYLPPFGELLLHQAWDLAGHPAPDAPGVESLHALRREVKRLRYRIECLEGWLGEEATRWLEELHAMQDALGAWHDEGVLLEWLVSAEAPEAVLSRVRDRARIALAPWDGWRARYLDPVERRRMRAIFQRPGPAPETGPGADPGGG